ncbi:hypothetical protein D8674_029549 [Pyrus ussuriensis x Pyrus communis]|uniref:PB1 domain-containing protein n=1 Tax=Pyrus ussuriensis x Pyrus communis TaxID=2448454 RepID=A0A5N5I4F9_9ROSA|nr:hypothetical protein D8674_029549 [Pyrus ussuriensis x Pyrus communis]
MGLNKAPEPLKLLCSYGGKILPRHSDGTLRYVGGHNRVLSVDSSITYTELMVKLAELCGYSVELRCPLPNGDLETLISVKSDEDLANIIEEYGRASSPPHSLKIRAILSPPKSLKQISPPMSTATSGGDSSPSKSLFSSADSPRVSPPQRFVSPQVSPPRRYVSPHVSPPKRYASPPARYPAGHQRGFGRVCYYPCHLQPQGQRSGPCDMSYVHHYQQYRHYHHHPRVPHCDMSYGRSFTQRT